jgi:hypothetical protein
MAQARPRHRYVRNPSPNNIVCYSPLPLSSFPPVLSGSQYRSAIFYHSEDQRQTAEALKYELQKSIYKDRPIVTEIVPASQFYEAEEWHQRHLEKHPDGHCNHRVYW